MNHDQLIDILRQEKERLFQYASYRLPTTQDAEDALQDLYISMTSKQREIRLDNPKPYIYSTLSNICADKLRKTRYFESLESDLPVITEAENFDEEFKIINSLLSMIPEEQSEVIRLHLHCEMTFAEVAEVMVLPVATVKSRFRYGVAHLRDELKRLNIL